MTTLKMLTLDCADPSVLATFYAALLGGEIVAAEEDYAMVTGADNLGAALGFGRVEGYESPSWPNEGGTKQYHLDLACEDVATDEGRALELGATLADPQPGEAWRVLLDPAGHPFCLTLESAWE